MSESQLINRINALEEIVKSLKTQVDKLPETLSSSMATIIIAQVCPAVEEIVNKAASKTTKASAKAKSADTETKTSAAGVNTGIHHKLGLITVKAWENDKQYIQQLYNKYADHLQTLIPKDVYDGIEESEEFKKENEKKGATRHKLSILFNSHLQKIDKDKLKDVMAIVNADREAQKAKKDNNDFQRVEIEEKSQAVIDEEKV
jgi:hypothetical protein